MLAVTNGISGLITSFLGALTAKSLFGHFLASEHFSTTVIVLVAAFGAVGQFTLVPILEKSVFRLVQSSEPVATPPINAEFLLYLMMSAPNCDALIGDLEERYRLIRKKFGVRKANFWYWTQAVRSVGPIVWAWVKKIALKPVMGMIAWAVAKGLVRHDSWLAALVEMWKRIRS